MREIVVVTQMTLDGVMQGPGGPEEDPSGAFAEGGWSVGYWDEALREVLANRMARPFDLLLGRKTYEIFAAHWPYAEGTVAERMNSATKYVVSRTLKTLEWDNSTLVGGEVETAVSELKAGDGSELQVHGSWDLIQTLLAHELIDEFRLWVLPVVVGFGKRLFGEATVPAGLTLVDSKATPAGVIVATYRPAGRVQKGSFAFEVPTEREIVRRGAMGGD